MQTGDDAITTEKFMKSALYRSSCGATATKFAAFLAGFSIWTMVIFSATVRGQEIVPPNAGQSTQQTRAKKRPRVGLVLSGGGTFDFTATQEIIKLGYEEAQAKIALLKSLTLDDADWQNHLAARRAKIRSGSAPVPEFTEIAGTESGRAI